jgi:hypothetical protein
MSQFSQHGVKIASAKYQITLEIQKLPEGPCLGTSPELPGLIVQGSMPEEVVELAPDVVRALGCVLNRQGKGNHLPKGTLSAILTDLGIGREEFDSV